MFLQSAVFENGKKSFSQNCCVACCNFYFWHNKCNVAKKWEKEEIYSFFSCYCSYRKINQSWGKSWRQKISIAFNLILFFVHFSDIFLKQTLAWFCQKLASFSLGKPIRRRLTFLGIFWVPFPYFWYVVTRWVKLAKRLHVFRASSACSNTSPTLSLPLCSKQWKLWTFMF